MNKRKKILSTSAAAALGLASLIGAAAPAQAVTSFSFTDCTADLDGKTLNVPAGETALEINFTTCLVTLTFGPGIGLGTSATPTPSLADDAVFAGQLRLSVNNSSNPAFITGSNLGNPIPDGTYQVFLAKYNANGGNPNPAVYVAPTQSFTIVVGGGGGGESSSSSSTAPQTFELSLTPTDGTTCTNSSESGRAGTWMTLPGANDCTPPATQANANLLGWATIPNFPVAIAQRQVDNGWGAYEIFNDEGQLTAVFIPAGGATFLSGSGQLYPIWSE